MAASYSLLDRAFVTVLDFKVDGRDVVEMSIEEIEVVAEQYRRLRRAEIQETQAWLGRMEADLAAHCAKRASALPLSLRALAACHPHTARALPLRWPLRLLGALAKLVDRRPRAVIDEVSRLMVELLAPGVTPHQRGCAEACGLAQAPAVKARQRKVASEDGICVANFRRVAKLLLSHSAGHGWSVVAEHRFLLGDSRWPTNTWERTDPSVVLAANVVGRLRKHSDSPTGPWNQETDRLGFLVRPDAFEDLVQLVRGGAGVPLPAALVCPVGVGSQLKLIGSQLKLIGRDNSSVRSLAVKAQDVGRARPLPALSAAGTPKAGKRRKVVDERTQQSQREAFLRLFHPTGHPAAGAAASSPP